MLGQEKIDALQWQTIRERFETTQNVPVELLDQIENVFINAEEFEPGQFERFSLSEIFDYLKQSHIHYLDVYLPKIENTLHQLYSKFGDRYFSIRILLVFLEKYKAELVKHILYEEQVLFMFVERLLKGEYSSQNKNFVINHFLHTHNDNVIIHLDELKKDLITFDEELKNNVAFQVLFHQLDSFQHDLTVHGLIEDNVFIDKILDYIHTRFEPLPKCQ